MERDGIYGIEYCGNIDETIKDADICLIFTEWEEIKSYDVANFQKLMKKPIVLDGRNCFRIDTMEKVGVEYEMIGYGAK